MFASSSTTRTNSPAMPTILGELGCRRKWVFFFFAFFFFVSHFSLVQYHCSRPHRLVDQDAALSRPKPGFESPWGHSPANQAGPQPKRALQFVGRALLFQLGYPIPISKPQP